MGGIVGGGGGKSAPVVVRREPQPAPSREDPEVQDAKDRQRRQARLARGRGDTILTRGGGLFDPVQTQQTRLTARLGGGVAR